MKKTFGQLQKIDNLVASLYAKDKTLEKSKFGYAYKRFVDKNYMPTLDELQERLVDIRISNALEDKNTGEVLTDRGNNRGFKYSRDGLKKCIKEERKAIKEFDEKEIEITPFISSYKPIGLTEEEKSILRGLLI